MNSDRTPEEIELQALLQSMSPKIADLLTRMMGLAGLTWEKARGYRDEIVELNKTAKTEEERIALVFAFDSLMNQVESLNLIDPSSLEHFRNVRESDYRWLLGVQAMKDDHVDPIELERVTRREVEAGRLSEDNKFRQFAIQGALEFGGANATPKGRSWLGRLFGRG
jgi:hypothetical protein